MEIIYNVRNELNIKEVLRKSLSMSSRLITKIKYNHLYLNGSHCSVNSTVQPSDIVCVDFNYTEDNSNIVSNPQIKLDILYEDELYIIINKPSNMPIHPSMEHYTDSLSNGVKTYFDSIHLHKKIRPVNRLDKDTSGIVVFAKNEYAQENFKPICKEYIAIINGIFSGNGIIDLPIGRKNGSIIERCIDYENGDSAITEYEVIKNISEYNLSIVKCTLMTGRTHQIRVHLANKLSPILGDTLYGSTSNLINRQALHSYHLRLIHPINKKVIDIYAPIPEDISNIIK
ncbi:pseudouridine synthase [Clostridium sp. CAG:793]|nr:pseudouridine synthase [Clostridium sp. CAG:793]